MISYNEEEAGKNLESGSSKQEVVRDTQTFSKSLSYNLSNDDFAKGILEIVNDVVSNQMDKIVPKHIMATVTGITIDNEIEYATVEVIGSQEENVIHSIPNSTGTKLNIGDNVVINYTDNNINSGYIIKLLRGVPVKETGDRSTFVQDNAIIPTACTLLLITSDDKKLAAEEDATPELEDYRLLYVLEH